ncbi:MAG: hypothetical protein JO296_11285 [Pseudonocardiales bacterium]|nr:hypothetical protein [Pseudonocardiales bacterium]MBV9650708.1 hypothetical protein [Pseudonocardiales bacterium]
MVCTQLDGSPIAVTGGSDRTVRVWDLRMGRHTNRIGLSSDVNAVTGTPAGGIVAACGWDIVLLELSME